MNKRQKMAVITALAIVVFLVLFPPWCRTVHGRSAEITIYRGFHWILSPTNRAGHIDLTSLLGLLGAVCAMAFLAYLELRDGPSPDAFPSRHRRSGTACR